MNKLLASLSLLIGLTAANAAVTVVSNENNVEKAAEPVQQPVSDETRKPGSGSRVRAIEVQSPAKKKLHIDGYIDKQYVRLEVEISNDKKLTGYLFDQSGVGRYVYGEKMDGVVHIYDTNGQHLTVIIDKQ